MSRTVRMVEPTMGKRHTLQIPGWRPALLNELLHGHWRRKHQLKKRDRKVIAVHAILAAVPRATGRRRVHLRITGRYFAGKFPDPDGCFKSLLDALVHAGLLIDDSHEWCEIATPQFGINPRGFETTIVLEDLEP